VGRCYTVWSCRAGPAQWEVSEFCLPPQSTLLPAGCRHSLHHEADLPALGPAATDDSHQSRTLAHCRYAPTLPFCPLYLSICLISQAGTDTHPELSLFPSVRPSVAVLGAV
jgi:hypothetical protein